MGLAVLTRNTAGARGTTEAARGPPRTPARLSFPSGVPGQGRGRSREEVGGLPRARGGAGRAKSISKAPLGSQKRDAGGRVTHLLTQSGCDWGWGGCWTLDLPQKLDAHGRLPSSEFEPGLSRTETRGAARCPDPHPSPTRSAQGSTQGPDCAAQGVRQSAGLLPSVVG